MFWRTRYHTFIVSKYLPTRAHPAFHRQGCVCSRSLNPDPPHRITGPRDRIAGVGTMVPISSRATVLRH